MVPYQESNLNSNSSNNFNLASRFSLLDNFGVDFVSSILTATILPKIALYFF